jgi:hypothetical protein
MKNRDGTAIPCIYCGAAESTSDHVPSRKFFPKPRPNDLITVPSCVRCNGGSSEDEEYFLNVILCDFRAITPAALAVRKGRFDKRTPRRLKMAERILQNVRMDDWRSGDGTILGRGPILKTERERLERVFEKITRGLYWESYKEPLPLDRKTDSKMDREGQLLGHPEIQAVLALGTGREIGNDAFGYRIVRATDGSHTGFVAMVFFEAVVVFTSFGRAEEIEARARRVHTPRDGVTGGGH